MNKIVMLVGLAVGLAGCQNTGRAPATQDAVPQAVWDRIPADTPLTEIIQGREDGCYWYMHRGPLETQLIPVRDVESAPICR